MAFFPPVPLIRRNHVIKKLKKAGATCANAAKTFAEAAIVNPNAFAAVTARMVSDGILGITKEGKYYLR